jgi:hypothetical protein
VQRRVAIDAAFAENLLRESIDTLLIRRHSLGLRLS